MHPDADGFVEIDWRLSQGFTVPDRLGGVTNRGGALVTGRGLVFIEGGDGYSYNVASPMTCRRRSGKQYVVIATAAGTDNALPAFVMSDRQSFDRVDRDTRQIFTARVSDIRCLRPKLIANPVRFRLRF